jgi:hypothetical protein
MTTAAFNKMKALFISKLDLNSGKKLAEYIWSVALYGVETWAPLKVGQKNQGSFEMWCWKRMERSVGQLV